MTPEQETTSNDPDFTELEKVAASLIIQPDKKPVTKGATAKPVAITNGADTVAAAPDSGGEEVQPAEGEEAAAEVEEPTDAEVEEPEESKEEDENLDDYIVPVVIDGKEVEVTLKDLKKEYSGNQFIEANIQKAVEFRKAAENEGRELYDANQTTLAKLEQLDNILKATTPEIDWAKLKASDPQAYILKREEQRELQEKQALVNKEVEKVNAQQADLRARATKIYLEDQATELVQKLPDFSDPIKAKKLMGSIEEAAKVYGYTPQEVALVMDHRALLVLHDAAEMQQIRAARAKIKTAAPPSIKKVLVRPGAASTTAPSKRLETELRNRAKKTGHVDDIAKMLIVKKR